MIPQYFKAIKYFSDIILKELNSHCECWIAGGCLREYFSKGYVSKDSDIDVYFPSEIEYDKGIKFFLNKDAKILFENENTVKFLYNGRQFDIIKRYFDSPETCIKNFDFTVCCAALTLKNVFVHDTFFMDLAKKSLVINTIPFPVSTQWRLQKYIKKGFTISLDDMLLIVKAIKEHDDVIDLLEKLQTQREKTKKEIDASR